jgi:hypothetical protein
MLYRSRANVLEWIFEDQTFSSWMAFEENITVAPRFLALVAPPGCGKSYMAASIVEQLEQRTSPLVFSYFHQRDHVSSGATNGCFTSSNLDLNQIYGSLLSQLMASQPDSERNLQRFMRSWWHDSKIDSTKPPHRPIRLWLADFMKESQQQTYIVLDGVTDILHQSAYHELLEFLQRVTQNTSFVRVLVTSRSPRFGGVGSGRL